MKTRCLDSMTKKKDGELQSCTGIPGKQWFLMDIPGVAGIVGRYGLEYHPMDADDV